jgi:uncharacterized membrane protein HdeD (DUF308 family)
MKNLESPLIWRGLLAIVVGVMAVAWLDITVGAFVILFAVYGFLAAGMEAARRANRSEGAGPVAGRLVLAMLNAAAGVVALVWPGITVLALALLIAVWAFILGCFEVYLAFSAGATAGERALLGLTGLITLARCHCRDNRRGYGLFSIVGGISSVVLGANLRSTTPLHVGP